MGIKEKMLNGEKEEILDCAVRICRGYLNGPWKKICADDVTVKTVSGGLSNWLFHVKLNKQVDNEMNPEQVLIRLYGQTHGEGALENLITESVIFTLLSERKLGPKLYGVFPGGRIEEFIPAKALSHEEICNAEMSLLVAERIAAVHSMNIPINKEPRWLWDTINRWLITIDELSPQIVVFDQNLKVDNLKAEVKWLRHHLSTICSPVVFCHNDLQQGNILLDAEQPPRLVLIDFEYCSYNYRGFDLANHFIEWTYDYSRTDYPHFWVHKDDYCSYTQMCAFINKYLDSMKVNGNFMKCKCKIDETNHIVKEVAHYSMASHLFWSLWSLVNAHASNIPFGYTEYAKERLQAYFQMKHKIIGNVKENSAFKRKVMEDD